MYGAEGGTAGTITAGRGPDGTGVVMRGDVGMVGAERTVGTAGAATCVEKFAATNAESFVTSGASIAGRRAVRTKWRFRDRHLHRAEIDCHRPLKRYNAGAGVRNLNSRPTVYKSGSRPLSEHSSILSKYQAAKVRRQDRRVSQNPNLRN